MAGIAAIATDSYSVLSSGTVSRVTASDSAASSSAATSSSGATAQTAAQSSSTIDKASTNASKALALVDGLRQELAQATKAGASISQDEITRLNQRLGEVRTQVDDLSKSAQVGSANLLAGTASAVTVSSASGDRVKVSNQQLDSKSLGLDKLSITDAQSLRQAAGQVALATGKAQKIDYNLQVAKSVITPARSNPGLDAFDQIRTAQSATPVAGSALASVEKAVSTQAAANARYDQLGGAFAVAAKKRANSILDLFG